MSAWNGAKARPDDVVTGEAVLVALPYAGLALRALSGAIDMLLAVVTAVAGGFAVATVWGSLDAALLAGVTVLGAVLILVALPSVSEITTGRTLGKKITGLRTVRDDGAPADARRIITRHLVGVVEIWMCSGAIAVVCAMLTEPTRRLGDLVAGTYVVRDRVRLTMPAPPDMPPSLAGWAATADIGVLPDPLVTLIRTTIDPRARYTPEARAAIETRIADELRTLVSPPPPAATTARAFIAAVTAERRRRETERLTSLTERRRRLFAVSR